MGSQKRTPGSYIWYSNFPMLPVWKKVHHYYGSQTIEKVIKLSLKDPGSKLARWARTLGEYDFEIFHRRGRLSGKVDALSRIYNEEDQSFDIEFEDYEKYLKLHQKLKTKNVMLKSGDPFSSPVSHALAHCVSQDNGRRNGIKI